MDLKLARASIIALRGALGVGAMVVPRPMGALFGVDPADNPVAPYLMRLFGARELLMAWQVYAASDEELETVISAAIPVDAADVLASILGGSGGYLPKRAAVMSGLSALGGVVHGVTVRRELKDSAELV